MSDKQQVSIFIAEDHLISRMGLKMLLEQTSHFKVVGESEDGESAVAKVTELKPDVAIMDLDMPKLNGIEATARVKAALPQTKVLIFTSAEDDESIFAALKAGADGYCLKTISGELLSIAIHSVLNGAAWLDPGIAKKVLLAQSAPKTESKPNNAPVDLTASKLKLLGLVEQGKSIDEIANELNINDVIVKGLLNELLVQLKGDKTKLGAAEQPKSARAASITGINTGDIIGGHYRIEELLGSGGMGNVYLATHTIIERKVAIKTLHTELMDGGDTLERFKTEAKASAAIVHPNLVTIFDFGLHHDQVPYLVMEYLDGISLADHLEKFISIDQKTCVSIFSQVCAALSAVHDKSIVHRDLKPSNIMLLRNSIDGSFNVKLVDFGIAKVLSSREKSVTQTGVAIGTPAYMSPEQCYARKVDHRSDLYSMGCAMFEALAGTGVFDADTFMELVMKHVNEKPSPEPLKSAQISPPMINLILKLLEKNPDKRPSTAAEVHKELISTAR